MIIVEDKLEEIFDYLPAMKYEVGSEYSFKPVFGFGDQMELNKFLKNKESESTKPYPLIWLLYRYNEKHEKKKVVLNDIVLILATNTNAEMSNRDRIETNFKKVLIPLYDNILEALTKSVNINLEDDRGVVKFPNFSEEVNREQSFTTELWDALKTTWNFEINTACFRSIKINGEINSEIENLVVPDVLGSIGAILTD